MNTSLTITSQVGFKSMSEIFLKPIWYITIVCIACITSSSGSSSSSSSSVVVVIVVVTQLKLTVSVG